MAHIANRFAAKEGRFWNSDLQIVDFLRIREVAFRPWAVDTIPRRFCTGQVIVSDGVKRRVNYSIVEDAGTTAVFVLAAAFAALSAAIAWLGRRRLGE